MIPHHSSRKAWDVFCPNNRKNNRIERKSNYLRLSSQSFTKISSSLPRSCVLNALLPSPWKWAFIFLAEKKKDKRRGRFHRKLFTSLVLKQRHYWHAAGWHRFFSLSAQTLHWTDHHYHFNNIFSPSKQKMPEAIQGVFFDVNHHILMNQKQTRYFPSPALSQRLKCPHLQQSNYKRQHIKETFALVIPFTV